MHPCLQKQYSELLAFLRLHQACWQHEVLQDYSNSLAPYPKAWLLALDHMSDHELWLMDAKLDFDHIPNQELKDCLNELERLTQVKAVQLRDIGCAHDPARAFYGVRGKKRHEIEAIAPILQELAKSRLVDIGGGQGHLARIMAKHFNVPTLSVDRDASLQELGRKNLARLPHRPYPFDARVEFETFELGSDQAPANAFAPDDFVLGLHTCGDLAWHLMQQSLKNDCAGLLSFGCCYSKMELDADGYALNGPKDLKLSIHSLTLATRGHKNDSKNAFDFKVLVKRFRYTLHLFHWHKRDVKTFIPMGETVPRVYYGEFSEYALPRLAAHGIEASAQELNAFFQEEWVQKECRELLYANLIRWQFGRALELVILLDRAQKLSDAGMEVDLATYFNERISPRNIGILARPQTSSTT